MKHKTTTKNIALVLTGGGARAAYQVGVLKAIAQLLSRTQEAPFNILCGTSAGSINATTLACYASCYHLGARKLEQVWKNFRSHQVYHANFFHVFGHILRNLSTLFQADYANKRPAALLNNMPLRQLLNGYLDLQKIDRNLSRGHLQALSITAASYTDGHSISFYQSLQGKNWDRIRRKGIQSTITTSHLMASSAIPLVFSSEKIREGYFGDGSIHQLSPLSPAVHLDAEKILIISVEGGKGNKYYGNKPHHPSSATIASHLLDTIFADTLSADLERMQGINNTVDQFKKSNLETPYKKVESLIIQPKHNFSEIAMDYYHYLPWAIRLLLRFVGVTKRSDSNLVSYLLFEQAYTTRLIQLGYEDGMQQLNEIKTFLEI